MGWDDVESGGSGDVGPGAKAPSGPGSLAPNEASRVSLVELDAHALSHGGTPACRGIGHAEDQSGVAESGGKNQRALLVETDRRWTAGLRTA